MKFGALADRWRRPDKDSERSSLSDDQSLENSVSAKSDLAPQRDASATEIEAKILSICRRLLRADDLSLSDNFFDEGGNSLLGMTLMLEIELQLDLEISLETIFRSSTVMELCTSVSESGKRMPTIIFPLRSGQWQKTLYFIHGGFEFSALSDALTSDISTAFVTPNDIKWLRELIAGRDTLVAIDRISDAYAKAIFAKHRTGPCYLGGVLALETARKLEELGVAPDIIFLLDTYFHNSLHRIIYDILHNRWLSRKLNEVLRGNRHEVARRARFLSRNLLYRLSRSTIFENSNDSGEDWSTIFRQLREEAAQAYRGPSRASKGHTVLFRATELVGGGTKQIDPDPGWARHLGANFTLILSPGDHYSLLKGDPARYVAGEINRRIALRA